MEPARTWFWVVRAASLGFAAVSFAVLGLGACAPVLESTVDRVSADKPLAAENLAVSPRLGKRPPRLVAVLGVENATPDPEASEIVRRLFYGNFSALPFRDVELGRADGALASAPEAPEAELAQRLGADAYVRGRVHRFERNYYGVYADLVADLEFELVEAASGETLWKARVEEVKRNVSLSVSPLGLAVGLASNALEISRLALVRTANDACRRLVASIPVPGDVGGRPEIREVLHGGLGRVLRRWERLEVALEGTPGLQASFALPGIRADVPLREEETGSGRYRGALVLPDGVESDGLLLEASLANDRGEVARWVDPLGAIRVDTLPPPAVARPQAEAGDGRVELSWSEPAARDLAGFRVLRSREPLQGYEVAGETQGTAFRDQGLQDGETYYYKVFALDRAGNEGEPSDRVAAVPVAPGPRSVRGRLVGATFWPRAGGPYVLEGDVEVPAGAELRVEAGTSIRGAPGSRLLVRGRLLARGTEERVVTFGPAADGPWGGLAFEGGGASASELVHALVEGADVGIRIADASPRLERVRLRGCGTGLAVAGPEAQPRLVRLLAYENRGAGLTVSRLAAPLVSQSKFLQNGGPGLSFDGGGGVVFQSEVRGNGGGGVAGTAPGFRLGYSRVYGNEGFELNLGGLETAWPAVDLNYWGDPDAVEAGASVPVNRQEVTVLRDPDPEAPTVALALLALPAPEGLAEGLWIRRSRWLALPEARVRHERPPFVVGLEALEEGDAEAAAAALEEAARLDPADPEAHYWLGLAHLRQGRPGPAAEALQRACLLSVKNPEYRRALAEAYLADGKLAEAELTLADVLKLDPRDEKTAAALERLRGR